jgi:dipeptidyl aminopeptidase/acylaminoacyl peptidase
MRFVLLLALLLGAAPCALAVEAALPAKVPALSEWVRGVEISRMTLSPDGAWIAGIGEGHGSPAFVMDVETGATTVIARQRTQYGFAFGPGPDRVHWITNDLLAVDFSDRTSFSVDRRGTRMAKLGERFIRRLPEAGSSGETVLAYRDLDDGEIAIVNARTGSRRSLDVSLPGKPIHWAFDPAGTLRAVTTYHASMWSEESRIVQWFRASAESVWEKLEEADATDDTWVPLRVLAQPHALAVLSRHGRDTYAVLQYDTVAKSMGEVLAGHPSEDIVDVQGLDGDAFEKVVTHGLKQRTYWFDARWAALQASVDAAIPGRINSLHGDPGGRVLVFSRGDVDRGHWYLLDTRSMHLREIAAADTRLSLAQMRPMQTLEYRARDGLSIPAYLTRPEGDPAVPAPMVVLIHGGPHVRDEWEWNQEVQVLAAHGYAVFQPQFRGSSGFGRRFEEAGYRQWGRSMQDDITDGVRMLVERGIADPARVCIYGASYGGYAALWGTVKTPELYRCAVSLAGVSDLGDLVSFKLFDDSSRAGRRLRRSRIGDPEAMKRELDEVSPLKNAARVSVPVLIGHGLSDTRVLPSHSKDMVRALQDLGKPVKWAPFENEGHGGWRVGNQIAWYELMLTFLHEHIGGRLPQAYPPKAAAGSARSPASSPR